jgi:hypothetical protein
MNKTPDGLRRRFVMMSLIEVGSDSNAAYKLPFSGPKVERRHNRHNDFRFSLQMIHIRQTMTSRDPQV